MFFRLAGESNSKAPAKPHAGVQHKVLSRVPASELGHVRPVDGNSNEEHNFAPFK